MSNSLAGVSVFVETVDAGGFSAAATRLNLSRSAVGKAIARLEDRLGTRLFQRTTRSQSLTEDGQAFYERCLRALEEIRSGEAMLEEGRREVAGRLRVSMPVLYGRRCVAPILSRLAQSHPKLELDLNFSDRIVDIVEDGFDMVVRNATLDDSSVLVARRIASQRMAVCASPAYLAAHGTPTSLEELRTHDAVMYARSGIVRNWLFPQVDAAPIEVAPQARLRFDDLGAIMDAGVAGIGLVWLPCWLIRDHVHSGTLVRILQDQPAMVFDSHAVWPKTPHLPLRVRLAINALAAEMPGATELLAKGPGAAAQACV